MNRRVSISKCLVHGVRRWRVRWHDAGKVHRSFFSSSAAADTFAAVKRNEAVGVKQLLASLPQAEQEKLVMLHNESRRRGTDVLSFLLASEISSPAPTAAGADVLAEMLLVKRNAGKDRDYLKSLRSVVKMFLSGRERLAVDRFTTLDVESFLDSKNIASRSTLRSRLSTFFKFARRRKYRVDNPCDDLESVTVLKKLPQIFSPEQAEACLKFLLAPEILPGTNARWRPKAGNAHRGLAWFLLTTFAALRPEEAFLCDPKMNLHLDADKPFIEVTPEITKTGHWRIVYPLPEVVTALRWAMDHGSELPFPEKAKRKLQKRLRAVLGWERWPVDVTRHSGGSYWLAMTQDLKLMVEMLGNSERIFKSHYKKPVPRAVASKFYAVLDLIK